MKYPTTSYLSHKLLRFVPKSWKKLQSSSVMACPRISNLYPVQLWQPWQPNPFLIKITAATAISAIFGGFLKWGYPVGFSIINHPAIGVPSFIETPFRFPTRPRYSPELWQVDTLRHHGPVRTKDGCAWERHKSMDFSWDLMRFGGFHTWGYPKMDGL